MGRAAKAGKFRPERTSEQLREQAETAMAFFERNGSLLENWRRDSALVGMMVNLGCSAVALHEAGVLVPLHLVERERGQGR